MFQSAAKEIAAPYIIGYGYTNPPASAAGLELGLLHNTYFELFKAVMETRSSCTQQRSCQHHPPEPVRKRQTQQLWLNHLQSEWQMIPINEHHPTSSFLQASVDDQASFPQQDRSRKRKRDSSQDHAYNRPTFLSDSSSDIDPVAYWARSGRWPKEYFESEADMSHPLARKKSSSSLRRKTTQSGTSTPSDQRPSEEKSAAYRDSRYESILATKNSFMDDADGGVTSGSEALCRSLLQSEQDPPPNSLFRDDVFVKTCQKVRNRNEALIVQDISRLIVPSAQNLAIFGAQHLEHLIENVNEAWSESIPLTMPRPQPDYCVGFLPSAFTVDQRKRLAPCIGTFTDTSFFVATWRMWFPFLTCEVKSGAVGLAIADRQNAHSATLAVRGVVELFRAVNREKELHREILAFSVSHDDTMVKIYGHYPLIEPDQTNYYRHQVLGINFTVSGGKEKWAAYRFTRNVYDTFMPMHLRRICSAIDELPLDINFAVSEHFEPLPLDDSHPSQQSEVDSFGHVDSHASLALSHEVTPHTSFTEQSFKKPKRAWEA